MRVSKQPRQKVMSFKVTDAIRQLVEQLAARLTIKRQERVTLTDVVEAAVLALAKKEGVG